MPPERLGNDAMAYIVNADITDRLGTARAAQLTTETGAVPSDAALDEIRQSAEGEVNGYLGRRYKVPIDVVTHADLAAPLKGITLDVAIYRAYMFRRTPVPEDVRRGREEAIEWLKGVAAGTIELPAEVTPGIDSSSLNRRR